MPTPLISYSTCSFNNQLYVIGGEIRNDKTSNFRYLPSTLVFKYDSQYHTWVRITDMNIPRYNAGKHLFAIKKYQYILFELIY